MFSETPLCCEDLYSMIFVVSYIEVVCTVKSSISRTLKLTQFTSFFTKGSYECQVCSEHLYSVIGTITHIKELVCAVEAYSNRMFKVKVFRTFLSTYSCNEFPFRGELLYAMIFVIYFIDIIILISGNSWWNIKLSYFLNFLCQTLKFFSLQESRRRHSIYQSLLPLYVLCCLLLCCKVHMIQICYNSSYWSSKALQWWGDCYRV